ncbi:MAG: hypothetical protein ACTH0F_16780, partial [Microbacterium sp.]
LRFVGRPADGGRTTGRDVFRDTMKYGYINYRKVIRRALELGYTGAFCCEHYGSDSIGVIAENVHYVRQVLRSALVE